MNAILGFSELLEDLVKGPKQKQYLSSIRSSGKSLLALINDILDLSKIEAGKIEIQYGAVNLEKLFKEIVMMFTAKAEEKELKFLTVIDKMLPKALHLDEVRVKQILINLVSNALKFTHKGYIKLEVKGIYYKNKSKIDLLLSVKDTGIGISSENKKVIFDAFRQSKKQSVGKYGGTGLGLSITKKLVELMEGTISLESSIGKGSSFNIILKDIAVASIDEVSTGREDALPANIRFRKQTILIVDDIESNRILLRESLRSHGLQTIEAVDGKQSIDTAREYSPDLILMDLRMPVMDGYEAIRILKADSVLKDIPVIVLTASAMKEDQEKIDRLNCEGYLRKPIEKNKLLRELVRHLAYIGEDQATGAVKTTTGKKADDVLTPGQRKKLPELITLMEGKLKDDHIKVTESFIMDDIKDFAARIGKLGKKYGIGPVREWADKITSQAESFDMEHLPATLDYLQELTDKVKKLAN
jgi:CheY-like chemotaxis protein